MDSTDSEANVQANNNSSKQSAPNEMDPSQDIRTKTGGAYIPPAKLRMMQQKITDKNSEAYQRLAWESLKKSINGLVNKVNVGNIEVIVKELFGVNLIRGRGLFCRSVLRAQQSSPTFTHVYAAFVAVVNTNFPNIGELLLKRLIVQFRRAYMRNDKSNCINTIRFIAHLTNQNVAHEILVLEILTLLLDNVTNDSVEVAIALLKECGAKLEDIAKKSLASIFDRLRTILHDGELNKRTQYMIEVMYAIRKDKFKDHPSILPELDLIEENEQITHLMTLEEEYDTEDRLNVFKLDREFQAKEQKYEEIKKCVLDAGDDEDSDGESDSDEDSDDDDDDDVGEVDAEKTTIIDNTETNLINLRKTIYLTIQSSLDFEECAHKLLQLDVKPEQYGELCNMIVDCCAQQRTYIKFFGLLAQRFCQLNPEYVTPFEEIFKNCYDTIHRFETCKLRNVAKLFAHLLYTDAIPWTVLAHIKLNENDTTSSSRVFIKILFQQLAESMGLVKLNQRIKDSTLDQAFLGLFPKDNPQYTRFAINFFTSIGLGGLTDDLREHLKTMATQKLPLLQESLAKLKQEEESDDSSSNSDSSSDDSDSSDNDSSSESSSSSDDSDSSEESDSSDDSDSEDDKRKKDKHGQKRDDHYRKSKHRSHQKRLSSSKHRQAEEKYRKENPREKERKNKDSNKKRDKSSYKKDEKDSYRLKERNRDDTDERRHRSTKHDHKSKKDGNQSIKTEDNEHQPKRTTDEERFNRIKSSLFQMVSDNRSHSPSPRKRSEPNEYDDDHNKHKSTKKTRNLESDNKVHHSKHRHHLSPHEKESSNRRRH